MFFNCSEFYVIKESHSLDSLEFVSSAESPCCTSIFSSLLLGSNILSHRKYSKCVPFSVSHNLAVSSLTPEDGSVNNLFIKLSHLVWVSHISIFPSKHLWPDILWTATEHTGSFTHWFPFLQPLADIAHNSTGILPALEPICHLGLHPLKHYHSPWPSCIFAKVLLFPTSTPFLYLCQLRVIQCEVN